MSIVPFGKTDLGPAAKALVKKIASATGTLYAPLGTILQAVADVSAAKIKAEGETEIELVRRRGLQRLAAEETKNQINLEAMYGKTFQICEESGVGSGTIEQMDDDWIVFHSEKARLVSDKEMQISLVESFSRRGRSPGFIFKAHAGNAVRVGEDGSASFYITLSIRRRGSSGGRGHTTSRFRSGPSNDVHGTWANYGRINPPSENWTRAIFLPACDHK